MNSLALCSLCLFLIAQSPWLTNATVFGDGSDLIGQICNENPEKKIECTNILRADPTVLGAKNLLQLSEAILNLAVNKTEKAEDFLKGLANTTDVPAIANCALYYENAVERFMNSLQKLKCQDLKVANYLAAIAGDEPSSCETELSAAHIVNHAISAVNHQTSLLSYIAFVATGKLS
ncbi:hypothetical protein AAZX31_14G019800 [Glycine max]|uniref:Pectinesterase inhibitor domain-containing protein n=1 Tax=Glycine max TaxID=3847 RepID=K7M4G9_SOYBN|nr:hypothetical protein JHK87_038516 [Glycine soja]KAG4961887.1 hypothetical protein JHK86_038755 [Glycine max]KAG4961889.1 hypothetical protein JHK86_038757 [Glycine max]KAG5109351.1 hypothetical protein JHK82_038574 [Glycine max]KAG5109353.1 hypothetical protein JHK82_038576 [Glycine max]